MGEVLAFLGWVALGGALGAVARFFISGLVGRLLGEAFPWGTLLVNMTGAFAIGVLAGLAEGSDGLGGSSAWAFVVVGGLGSFTTVSSFSLQTLALAQGGEPLRAGLNVALSLTLCLGAAAAGIGVAALLAGGRVR